MKTGHGDRVAKSAIVAVAVLFAAVAVVMGARRGLGARAADGDPAASAPGASGASSGLAPLPLPTVTDGEIAVKNLDVQIASLDKRLAASPKSVTIRASLVGLLLSRAGFLGRIADYERAHALADEGVTMNPTFADAWLARASSRSALHEFDAAWADLARAEELGAPRDKIAALRAGIRAAQGRLDEALALGSRNEHSRFVGELGSLGLLYDEMGRAEDATRVLGFARGTYRDVSPLPLAWLDYQEGAIAERRGDRDRARQLYTRAITLVPRYAPAGAHLAPYVGGKEGLAILDRIAERADDPEIDVVRAKLLKSLGREDEARERIAAAAKRYDALVAAHPAAFADHAARFWLDAGDDPAKAHALAMQNLATRETTAALDLALTTATVAKRDEDACAVARRATAAKYVDDTLAAMARGIAARCAADAAPQ